MAKLKTERSAGRYPRNKREWQDAVNLAEVSLRIDSARNYGLIQGGPSINCDRCCELIALGMRHGVRPDEPKIDPLAVAMVREWNSQPKVKGPS